MTEKLLGNMLGLSPGDVTKATDLLQKAGLIHYNAGEITVLDRARRRKTLLRVRRSGQKGK